MCQAAALFEYTLCMVETVARVIERAVALQVGCNSATRLLVGLECKSPSAGDEPNAAEKERGEKKKRKTN